VLLRLDLRWMRYAPFTASGAVAAGGLVAVLSQYGEQGVFHVVADSGLLDRLAAVSPVLVAAVAVVVFVLLATVLGVLGYLVTNWGFVLTRDVAGRTLHVRRGLLTSTETSMEVARIRGVEVDEPLPLRLAGGARSLAVVTGLGKDEAASRVVVPPAPRAVAYATADQVLADPRPLRTPLRRHGSAARRRRWTRALSVAALLPILGVVGTVTGVTSWWVAVLLLLALPLAALVAEDRYRRLGHALTADHLVVRSGTFRGHHVALQRHGVIGWNLRQTWFQRRAGLVDLVATTAAGAQSYVVRDVPEPVAVALAAESVPGLVEQFLAPARSD
jgi:putative membrane protein